MRLRQARTEKTICYAVLIRRKDGSEFFSAASNAGRALFYKRAQAVAHRNRCATELAWPRSKLRVVKVESIIREVSK
jgi:hypothetical protein